MRKSLFYLSVLVSAALPLRAQGCGDTHWRWSEKIETDIAKRPVHPTTITSMLHSWDTLQFDRGDAYKCAARVGREQNRVSVKGWVRRVADQTSDDGDWHIELTATATGPIANCVVVEIPPANLSSTFAKAREDLLSLLGKQGINANEEYNPAHPVHVLVTGAAFFDGEHRRKAPNRDKGTQHGRCDNTLWEVHPVYGIARAP